MPERKGVKVRVSNKYPIANLSDKEITELKNHEKELNRTNPGSETILIAYTKQ